ncbi:MAG: VTT domain-containing protein [Patescibacteria group bacterium]|nr:VTT domain-containing protein [Patescibacteria group bacterium]
MQPLFLASLLAWKPAAYLILFIGMMVEGETVFFIAAFLTHQGYFSAVPIFITALWGMIIGDTLWYSLGYKIKRAKSLAFVGAWAERIARPFDEHLRERPFHTIFISKFTYGFNRAIITRAGMLNLKWRNIEESDILATLVWLFIIGGLGYFSSASLAYFKNYIRYGEVGLLIAVILFIVLERLIAARARKRL